MSTKVNKSEFVRSNLKLDVADIIAKGAEAGLVITPGLVYGLRSKAKLAAAGVAPAVKPGKKAKKKARKIAIRTAQRHVPAPRASNGSSKVSPTPVAIVFFDSNALVNSMRENFPQLSQGR
jgi:hypothetical protein